MGLATAAFADGIAFTLGEWMTRVGYDKTIVRPFLAAGSQGLAMPGRPVPEDDLGALASSLWKGEDRKG